MTGAILNRNGNTRLSEFDVFNKDDMDICFYCNKLFPTGNLAQVIKDSTDWDNGIALACPFCRDERGEEQKQLAWNVIKTFLADQSLIVLNDYADYSDDESTAKYDDCFILDEGSSLHGWEITSTAVGIIGPITVGQKIYQ